MEDQTILLYAAIGILVIGVIFYANRKRRVIEIAYDPLTGMYAEIPIAPPSMTKPPPTSPPPSMTKPPPTSPPPSIVPPTITPPPPTSPPPSIVPPTITPPSSDFDTPMVPGQIMPGTNHKIVAQLNSQDGITMYILDDGELNAIG